jgi:hypothetical protein
MYLAGSNRAHSHPATKLEVPGPAPLHPGNELEVPKPALLHAGTKLEVPEPTSLLPVYSITACVTV